MEEYEKIDMMNEWLNNPQSTSSSSQATEKKQLNCK